MRSVFDVIIFWFNAKINKTKYLGHEFQWTIFEIIALLE